MPSALIAVGSRLHSGGAGRRDRRRRRDVSVSDLLRVVRRVREDASPISGQLPVDWFGRRHPAAHRPVRLLRRHRHADDRRRAAGRPAAASSICRPWSARSRRSTTSRASPRELKFSGPLLADIFLGKITNWNDPAIARLNAGVALPPVEITPVYRAESSGTSIIWSDFLSKTSPEWRRLVGATRVIKIPAGVSARRQRGRVGARQADGGRDRLRRSDLRQAQRPSRLDRCRMPKASSCRRRSPPSPRPPTPRSARCRAICACRSPMRRARASIPISSFTWILLYESVGDRAAASAMVEFMRWALSDGQRLAPDLGYAPLPAEIVKMTTARLNRVKVS